MPVKAATAWSESAGGGATPPDAQRGAQGAEGGGVLAAIFLDFDGVLLTKWTRFRRMDVCAVSQLNRLCRESGAGVVISSTWRHIGLGRCRAMLREADFKGKVLGATPTIWGRGFCRGDEIQDWLARHPEVERFVILDDDDDMGELLPYLVRTETLAGLTGHEVDRALAMLTKA